MDAFGTQVELTGLDKWFRYGGEEKGCIKDDFRNFHSDQEDVESLYKKG